MWLAGAEDGKRRARGALDAMASAIHDVGNEPPAANIAKLAANLMVLSSVEMIAEALEFAARGGVDRRALAAALTERLFTGPVVTGYGMRMANRSIEEKGFKVALALKGQLDEVLPQLGRPMRRCHLLTSCASASGPRSSRAWASAMCRRWRPTWSRPPGRA